MTEPALRLEHVTYRYPDGRLALEDVSVDIPAGARTALIGPNGSGKSTLLTLSTASAGRNPAPSSSRDSRSRRRTLPEVRRAVGLVFQDPDVQLFCPTVEEDIAFGLLNLGLAPDEVRQRTAEALAFVGLEGFERRSPFHLSGGEKKLVSLATVLAMRPPVLALDEPTANLDAWHRRRVIEVLAASRARRSWPPTTWTWPWSWPRTPSSCSSTASWRRAPPPTCCGTKPC